jgi:hypothetical protein
MNLERFQHLSDESRLWVYGFGARLRNEDRQLLEARLAAFLTEWETHGSPVEGAFDFLEDRFLLLAGFAPGGLSGCSVDASVRVFKDLRGEGLDGLDRSRIYFRSSEGDIRSVHFSQFQTLVDSGEVGGSTPVFDTNFSTLGQLRSEAIEKPLAESWHARAFALPQAVE